MSIIDNIKLKSAAFIGAFALALGMGMMSSCVDDINVGNDFLDKQPGVDVTMDTIFSKGEMPSVCFGTCTALCTILSHTPVPYGIHIPMLSPIFANRTADGTIWANIMAATSPKPTKTMAAS